MKMFFSEFKSNYKKYFFPYQVWLLKEKDDDVEKIYYNGFLPIRNRPDVYYVSRNIRVNLENFEISSENKRILKKTEGFNSQLIPVQEFKFDETVLNLCKTYADNRFGIGVFSEIGIKSLFSGKIYNNVFVFRKNNIEKPVGFAVCFISKNILQYAHSFYDLQYLEDSLGARMILESVVWAKENNKKFAHLGTCYEEKSLYKTEFKGVEFFNGFRWSNNLEELKNLINEGQGGSEGLEGPEYLLKRKDFIERFYNGDLFDILSKYGVRVNF